MLESTIVATLKRSTILKLLLVLCLIVAYIIYLDVTGLGLRRTIFYSVIGILVYPVFYGASIFGVYKFAVMLMMAEAYVRIEGKTLFVGNAAIQIDDIEGILIDNSSFVEVISIARKSSSPVKLRSYMFVEESAEIRDAILSHISKARG